MGQKYKDSAKAAAEADRISRIAGQNLQQVLLSLRNCFDVVQKTKRMLEVDPDCTCVKSNDQQCKWEKRRRELLRAADSFELAMGFRLCDPLDGIETSLVDTDDNLLWCDRVCVHEKVDMDSALWCNTPQTILELVFARLPLHQIFQLRSLSKHWRASIISPSFQNALDTTTSRRFAIMNNETRWKILWSFGVSERKWHVLPFDFLPIDCNSPVAGDGGLLCCRCPALPSRSGQAFLCEQVKQDLRLYVCNPLTQAWRKVPLPLLVQGFDLVQLVTDRQTKQYTITVLNDLQQGKQHSSNIKAVVEVYNSSTNMWTASNAIFESTGTNPIYYKKYIDNEFVGIRAYDKATGYTSIPVNVPEDIFFSEDRGFHHLTVYQGQIYVLRTEAAASGIGVLRGPSHEWEKICSVPKPEILKFYRFSLYVYADIIIIYGDKLNYYDYLETLAVADSELPSNIMWMLDRAQDKWIDALDDDGSITICSPLIFEMRLDGIP